MALIKTLKDEGYKIIEIIPATPNSDTEIILEKGFSIQICPKDIYGYNFFAMLRDNPDGVFTTYPEKRTVKGIMDLLKYHFNN